MFSRKKQSTITFLVSKFNNNSSLCRWIVDSLTLDCLPYRVRIQWICFRCQLFVYFRFLLKKVNKQLYVSGFFFKLINFCIACMMVNGSTMTHRTGNLKKSLGPEIRENDSLHFTRFLAWTLLYFPAYCAWDDNYFSVKLFLNCLAGKFSTVCLVVSDFYKWFLFLKVWEKKLRIWSRKTTNC